MPTVYDIRALNELAFQAQILTYGPSFAGGVVISSDTTKQDHTACKVMSTDPREEISPGCGIYLCRLDVDVIFKADLENSATTSAITQAVRQTFYRNDLDPRPMANLAKMLTANQVAAGNPYTCLGVVPVSEGPIGRDQENRQYTYRFSFDVHAMPRNP